MENEIKSYRIWNILLIIIVVILLIFIIILIVYNVLLSNRLILPQNCQSNSDQFTILTNRSILTLNTCGENKRSPCTFTNISTYNDAVNKCTLYNCNAFTYSELTKQMIIVSDNLNNTGPYTVYVKQT